jgi:hypothetical protein
VAIFASAGSDGAPLITGYAAWTPAAPNSKTILLRRVMAYPGHVHGILTLLCGMLSERGIRIPPELAELSSPFPWKWLSELGFRVCCAPPAATSVAAVGGASPSSVSGSIYFERPALL